MMVLMVGCSNNEEPVTEEPKVHIPALRASLEDAKFNWDVLTTDPHTESLHELHDVTEETVGDEFFYNVTAGENIELTLTQNNIREKLAKAALQMPIEGSNSEQFFTAVTLLLQSTQPIINEEGRTTIIQELGIEPSAVYDNINSTYDTKSTFYSLQVIEDNLVFAIEPK